jgi:hypothetical protein
MPKSVFAVKLKRNNKKLKVLELRYQSVLSSLYYIGMEW